MRTNWARNIEYKSSQIAEPTSVPEVCDLVASSSKVKALGTRHAFNRIADTEGVHISMRHLDRVRDLNKKTVIIEGGVRYGELARKLSEHGLALRNLASLPHISVAGAISTATHGSGIGNQGLASAVTALSFVTANGEIVSLERGEPNFAGAVVSLGALGVIVELTLEVVPFYEVKQTVYEGLSFEAIEDHLEEIMSAAYSVSIFSNWQDPARNQLWVKRLESGESTTLFGARAAANKRHPIWNLSAEHCTEQLGVVGPWHERLPHFKLDFTPSSGQELQTEYILPIANGSEAIRRIRSIEAIPDLLQVSEIRVVAADDLWLSPFYGQDSVCLHFTWQPRSEVLHLLPEIEQCLGDIAPRPHWAKLYANLVGSYPRLPDFIALARRLDPQGKLENDYLRELFQSSAKRTG